MFDRINTWWRRRGSPDEAEGTAADGRRSVDNTDAVAAVGSHITDGGNNVPIGGGMPPDYVKSYDEGRPRK